MLAEIVERRGGALVVVDSVEEVFRDRDFDSVHTIVLAKPRPMADWPEAYATAKKRAGDRDVFAVVALPPTGAVTQALSRDRFVMAPPVTPDVWMRALEDHGWTVKS